MPLDRESLGGGTNSRYEEISNTLPVVVVVVVVFCILVPELCIQEMVCSRIDDLRNGFGWQTFLLLPPPVVHQFESH